jgi:ribokinase
MAGVPAVSGAGRGSVVVVGDVAVDYYLMLPQRHFGDEKVTASGSLRLAGGTGANAAAAAAALGSRVTLLSLVGADGLGEWLVESLTARGVSTSGVATIAGPTTQATILLRGDDREVIVDRGVADRLEELDPGQVGDADVVYVTGSGPVIRRFASAGAPARVVVGVEAEMAGVPGVAGALATADLVITNSAGWAALTRSELGAVTAVETRGPAGVLIHDPAGPDRQVPGIRIDAVDSTGAGDCFAGAVCHYLAAGLDLPAACQLAVAAAALSTRAVGAQSALPSDPEVRAAAAGQLAGAHAPVGPGEIT